MPAEVARPAHQKHLQDGPSSPQNALSLSYPFFTRNENLTVGGVLFFDGARCILMGMLFMTAASAPDLHVVSLTYKLRPSDTVTYLNQPPIDVDTNDALLRLSDGKLVCTMTTHFSTAEGARAAVEPLLRAWEVEADLRRNRDELRFEFEGAEIIDRYPYLPGEVRRVSLAVNIACGSSVGIGRVHIQCTQYPAPPTTFRLNPDAESLLLRYNGYFDNREPLLSMAYFCLTVVETNAGGRPNAAARYRIKKAVLNKIGELTSRRGDRSNARKIVAGPTQPLSGPERVLLEAAIKELIFRLGDTRTPAMLPWIGMQDLPTI